MDDIGTLLKEALPMCCTPATQQPILNALQDLGVLAVEDMMHLQPEDLARVLKLVQARKLLAHVKSKPNMFEKH